MRYPRKKPATCTVSTYVNKRGTTHYCHNTRQRINSFTGCKQCKDCEEHFASIAKEEDARKVVKALPATNMYPNTKTWNPFVGCLFDCIYCRKSFQKQLKRVGHNLGCEDCRKYAPHFHKKRLTKIPSAEIVFVAGTADISFCDPELVRLIFRAIEKHKPRRKKVYYFQSKNPLAFNKYMDWFQTRRDVILVTTLETNRDEGYSRISKAPPPSYRFWDFYEIKYPRKVVTIEPVLDFDHREFVKMFDNLHMQGWLEYVWFGFDSKKCNLPEPSEEKAQKFVDALKALGIEVRGKSLRGVKLREGS